MARANELFRQYALHEDGDEAGAQERRCDIQVIDPEKGRATGYIAKYVSKSIDGYQVGDDLYGKDAVESAARIKAWASVWGIRQFQFIGSPSVTVYRELRRLKSVEGIREGLIQELEKAADSGNWKRYVELMGGAGTKQKDQPIRAMMLPKGALNKYYEETTTLRGLFGNVGRVVTRIYDWTIRRARQPEDEGDAVAECGVFIRGANAPPWSSVNNCTRG